ncbi:MAG: PQQ-binding-like beta-propeller repeat protein, partial [Halobacteriales archaeon]
MPRVESTRRLGPTNYQARAGDGTLIGDTLLVVTFRQEPVHLAAYDPAEGRVTDTWEVPVSEYSDSPGATTIAAYDERYVYALMHTPAELFRFDRETETFDRLATLPTTSDRVSSCCGIEVREGRVFLSTKNDPVLYELDHEAGDLRQIGPPHPDAWKAYALAVGEDRLYVGGGSDAYLSAVDPETGERRDILPPQLADEAFVRSAALTADDQLVVGVSDRLAVFDPDGPPSDATVVDVDPEGSSTGVGPLHVTDRTVYFTTSDPAYTVWAYELDTGALSAIAAPIDHGTGYLAP